MPFDIRPSVRSFIIAIVTNTFILNTLYSVGKLLKTYTPFHKYPFYKIHREMVLLILRVNTKAFSQTTNYFLTYWYCESWTDSVSFLGFADRKLRAKSVIHFYQLLRNQWHAFSLPYFILFSRTYTFCCLTSSVYLVVVSCFVTQSFAFEGREKSQI